jgi:uncharacterized protein YbaP (TraB family)
MNTRLHCVFLVAFASASLSTIAQQNSVFYKLQSNNETAYLLGVVNAGDDQLVAYSDEVFQALSASQAFVLMTPTCEASILETDFPYSGKGNIESFLNNTNFLALESICQRYLGRSAWEFVDIQPLALKALIEQAAAHQGGSTTAEDMLAVIAREQGKPLKRGLSPTLCAAIETVPVSLQADMLITTVDRYIDNDYSAALSQLYLDGNTEALSRLVSYTEHVEYQVQLREEWITNLERTFNTGGLDSTFFVVDATLLGDRNGLIRRLRSAGLTVEPLNSGLHPAPIRVSNRWLSLAFSRSAPTADTVSYYDIGNLHTEAALDSILPRWYPLVSHAGGFTARMPVRPAFSMDRTRASDDYVTTHLFKCEDLAVNSFYSIAYTNYPMSFQGEAEPGSFFRDIVAQAVSSIRGVLLSDVDISLPPVRGREIEIEVEEDFIVRSRFYLVDNRFYQIMVGNSKRSAYSAKDNAFLGSLRIMDQKSATWDNVNFGTLSAQLPSMTKRETKVLPGGLYTYNYSTEDVNTGLSYTISYTPYPPAATSKPVEELYNGMTNSAVVELRGTLLRDSPYGIDDYPGREIEIAFRENAYCRMRLFVKDNRLVQLIVSGPGESIYSTFAERFMASLDVGGVED